ncbi:MAG: Flp pilus assembly complex ATPase component TadA [Planctomycetes bacterium]|nr:Flp pilus assembly complex ATPase component TadA [Planctomycetota bacterium]
MEPRLESDLVVRIRVDGVCMEHARLPKDLGRNVLARIKIMAGLDIAEHRLPQDGIRKALLGLTDVKEVLSSCVR